MKGFKGVVIKEQPCCQRASDLSSTTENIANKIKDCTDGGAEGLVMDILDIPDDEIIEPEGEIAELDEREWVRPLWLQTSGSRICSHRRFEIASVPALCTAEVFVCLYPSMVTPP